MSAEGIAAIERELVACKVERDALKAIRQKAKSMAKKGARSS
jgi:hypothetical protein